MKIIKYCAVFLLTLVFIPNVYARELCTKTRYDELKEKADKIKITIIKEKKDEGEYSQVEAENVDDDLMIFYNGTMYEPIDGKISFVIDKDADNYDLKIYGGYNHPCVEEYVATKRIYNKYSEKDECEGNEEWDLCKKDYNGYIKNDEEFKKELDEYLKSEEKINIEKEKSSNKTKKIIIIGGTIVILIGGLFLYKNNLKNKSKKSKIIRKSE